VGQQNVEGKRIPFGFRHRTLPHFIKVRNHDMRGDVTRPLPKDGARSNSAETQQSFITSETCSLLPQALQEKWSLHQRLNSSSWLGSPRPPQELGRNGRINFVGVRPSDRPHNRQDTSRLTIYLALRKTSILCACKLSIPVHWKQIKSNYVCWNFSNSRGIGFGKR